MARRIAVLTTGRQDYGIMRSTILALSRDPEFECLLWVGGMHLSERFGKSVDFILADGLTIDQTLTFVAEPPDPVGDSARATMAVGAALQLRQPDALMVLGDRFETLAACMAATILAVPIVHLHGGEETEGAIDNAIRHAITKLSHLHLVSHERHASRVRQMGEADDSVVVVGLGGVENAYRDDLPSLEEALASLAVPPNRPLVLVTLHPTTLGGDPGDEARALTSALDRMDATYIVTLPNADPGGDEIRRHLTAWAESRNNVALRESVGERLYWTLLQHVDAVVGNSSSGILEAPAVGAPVVNIGDRQRGRQRFGAVRDVPAEPKAIASALNAALKAGRTTSTPPSAERASARIVAALRDWNPPRPPRKVFHELD